jgi:hypothetical protein
VWYVAFEGKDWMLALTREGDRFRVDYRFRYYHHPQDPWDGKDRKNWFGGVSDSTFTRDEAISKARLMATITMIAGGGSAVYECVRSLDETVDEYFERFMQLPFVHARRCTEEEYRELTGKGAKP